MESIEITRDNIEKVKEAEKKKLRKIALAVVIACICVALLCVRALDRDKELHIGLAVGAYPGGENYSELKSLIESVVDDLGYSEFYSRVVIYKVDVDYTMYYNRNYNLLLLPNRVKRVYQLSDLMLADLSDSQPILDSGLEDFCVILVDTRNKLEEAELERLTAIGEALK